MPSDRPAAPVSSTYWSHFSNLRCHLLDFDVSVRNNGQTQENQSKWAGSAASCRSAGQSWLIKSKQQPHPSAWRPTADQLCVCVCALLPVCRFNTQTIWDYAERQAEVFKPPAGDRHTCRWRRLVHKPVLALFVCWRCLCVRAVLSASAADVFLFVVDPGRVVFGFLGLIHFTTETGIWNAHNSLLWIGAELKKLTERGSSCRPEAHPPPKSLEPGPVVMATPPLLRLVI